MASLLDGLIHNGRGHILVDGRVMMAGLVPVVAPERTGQRWFRVIFGPAGAGNSHEIADGGFGFLHC